MYVSWGSFVFFPLLKCRNQGTFVMIFDILLDDVGIVDFDDFLQRRVIFVVFMDGEDVGIGRILVFPQEGIRYRVQPASIA